MSIQNYPLEVLLIIFRYVKLNRRGDINVLNCAQVCRSWYEPACRFLYEEINFGTIHQSVPHHVRHLENMGKFCTVLRFDRVQNGEETYRPEEYELLLSYLPNLQFIVMEDSPYRAFHLQQLASNAKLVKQLKHISGGKYGWSKKDLQLFVECASKFIDTLQELNLQFLNKRVSVNGGRKGSVLSLLPLFKSLTKLSITNWESHHPVFLDMSMFSILRSCPNLVRFEVQNDFMEPLDRNNDLPGNHSKLRCLHIIIPNFTKQHIVYMYKNMTKLCELTMSTTRCYELTESLIPPKEWMQEVGLDHQFHSYLATIDKVKLDFNFEFEATISEQFAFINGILKNQQSLSSTQIILRVDHFDDEINCQELTMVKSGNNISFCCGVQIREWIEMRKTLPTLIPSDMTDHIRSMEIHFKSSNVDDDEFLLEHRSEVVGIFSKHFTNLDSLDISVESSYSKLASRIKVMSSKANEAKPNYIANRLSVTKKSCTTTSPRKLEYVLMRHSDSSQKCITSMLDQLPHTKYLKLLGRLFANQNTVDLGGLHLEQFLVEIPFKRCDNSFYGDRRKDRSIILKIEEDNSKKISYYRWNRIDDESDYMKFESMQASSAIECQKKYRPRYFDTNTEEKQQESDRLSIDMYTIKCFKIEQLDICSSNGIAYTTIKLGEHI